jgi:ABC-type cobalamin/Fe3+-siderophores transport system ATPase subunit
MPAVIHSDQLGFHYGKRPIFNGLSFSVEAGDRVALLGANGVGKTTLLNIIAGLLKAELGSIAVGGRDIADWHRRELSRFVALVPQHLEVPFSFSVEEIVSQGRVPYLGRFGAMSSHDREVVEQAMELVDVTDFRNRVYSELSGGERQRVKIAIALAQQPRIMLLDEPTQHLDIGRQVEVINLLKKLNQGGITIFAAIHDLSLVRSNFNHAILLMNQNGVADSTDEIMQPTLLEQAFRVDATALRSYCEPTPSVVAVPEEQRDCRHLRPERKRRFRRPI